jgi:hypothetical protein
MSGRQGWVGRIGGQGWRGLRLRLVLILGDAIDFYLVAVTTGDGQEQQRRQNRQQPGAFIEPAPEGDPGFFNRMTYHDTKLDDGLMKIQVYSGRRAGRGRRSNASGARLSQPQQIEFLKCSS